MISCRCRTDTPSAISGPTAVVTQSQNSYWTAGFNTAYVLDLKTDLNIDYLYSRADNYYDNSAGSQPDLENEGNRSV